MNKEKIAIQGVKGSNHYLAALQRFGADSHFVECDNFDRVFQVLKTGKAGKALVAIENTVAGTILPNYALMRESESVIVGEVYLRIEHCLMALPGNDISKIKEVQSHPMALLQCKKYFERHPHIKLVEAEDTAGAAKMISENHVGAIAGEAAAALYGLEILAKGIETHKKNFTRFLILSNDIHSETSKEAINKASISFTVKHEKGSLAKILTILADRNINLSKIQSLPLIGREWEYYIHVDMEFDGYEHYKSALEEIRPMLNELNVLGEYTRGKKRIELINNVGTITAGD